MLATRGVYLSVWWLILRRVVLVSGRKSCLTRSMKTTLTNEEEDCTLEVERLNYVFSCQKLSYLQ